MENINFIHWVLLVVFVIIIIYYFIPEFIPTSAWKNKHWRRFCRFMDDMKTSFNDNLYRPANEMFSGNPDGAFPYRGQEEVISQPVISYYDSFPKDKYGENAIVVGLHYTDWCHYCDLIKPIWFRIKKDLENSPNDFSGVLMIENNEEKNPTRGINSYPTIIKYRGGKARRYDGVADYNQLREWILSPFQVTTYGSTW